MKKDRAVCVSKPLFLYKRAKNLYNKAEREVTKA